jgi:hypothetical protein
MESEPLCQNLKEGLKTVDGAGNIAFNAEKNQPRANWMQLK